MSKKPKRVRIKDIGELEALDGYAIIEAHDPEDVTEGGIVIPDKAQKNTFQGTVVAVGPGKIDNNGNRIPIDLEAGDVVLYRNFLGWKMPEIEGKTYFAISEDERIAKIPKGKVHYQN